MKHTLRIFNETDIRIPRKKLQDVYAGILSARCDLVIICTDDGVMRKLNLGYRKKEGAANVLTFPAQQSPAMTPMPAEMYINVALAVREARKSSEPYTHRVLFLAIHGMLHLLGHTHGPTMERLEDKYATTYI